MTEVGFGSDGDFSDDAMIMKCNANLANELGNLCQRVMTMIYKNCNQSVPEVDPTTDFNEVDNALIASAQGLLDRAAPFIRDDQAIQKYAGELIGMVWEANKYIDEMAPWVLRKENPERMKVVLYVLMEVLRYVAILYQPIIPASANKILDLLTVPGDQRTFAYLKPAFRVAAGSPVSKPEGVFPRIELPELVKT
jgi:methionyl-tRNA synthetase